jgi:hypothetical protein
MQGKWKKLRVSNRRIIDELMVLTVSSVWDKMYSENMFERMHGHEGLLVDIMLDITEVNQGVNTGRQLSVNALCSLCMSQIENEGRMKRVMADVAFLRQSKTEDETVVAFVTRAHRVEELVKLVTTTLMAVSHIRGEDAYERAANDPVAALTTRVSRVRSGVLTIKEEETVESPDKDGDEGFWRR